MIEIRLHGSGGQGVVTAAELIAQAAFSEGEFSQAFPFFGVERQGAPIESFARIDDKFIRLRQRVYNPDYVIILDSTLLGVVDVLQGAKKNTKILINSKECMEGLLKKNPELKNKNVFIISAAEIALRNLKKPIVNTVMLGFFAAVSGLIKLDSIEKMISEKFASKMKEGNIAAAKEGYGVVKS